MKSKDLKLKYLKLLLNKDVESRLLALQSLGEKYASNLLHISINKIRKAVLSYYTSSSFCGRYHRNLISNKISELDEK